MTGHERRAGGARRTARGPIAPLFVAALAAIIAAGAGVVLAPGPEGQFTSEFALKSCRFTDRGANPLFNLRPHSQSEFRGLEDGETRTLRITVLGETERVRVPGVGTVKARVVEEREWADGELVEISRNFYAVCEQTQDVFYFGEDVDLYADGEIVGHEGKWRAGEQGALPGIIMPGRFLLGSRYVQEHAPGVAMDRAEHAEMGLRIKTAAGTFDGCVTIMETTPLDPDEAHEKAYCPGVGLVRDGGLELARFRTPKPQRQRGDDDGD